MTSTRSLRIFVFYLATIWPASPLVSVATAYQCAELSEYIEMWDDSEEDNDVLGLYSRAIADAGGEPCGVTVRGYIKGPDGTELVSAYGNGTGYATATVVVYLDENSAEGTYEGNSEAWSQGVHYGCAITQVGLAINIAPYVKSYEGSSLCAYLRCSDGPCPQAFMRRSKFPSSVCTQYAVLTSLRINYPLYAFCLFLSPIPVSSCSG